MDYTTTNYNPYEAIITTLHTVNPNYITFDGPFDAVSIPLNDPDLIEDIKEINGYRMEIDEDCNKAFDNFMKEYI